MRRLRALVVNLPPDAALRRAADPVASQWGVVPELLAAIAELVDVGNRYFAQANSKKGTPQPKPVRILRPGQQRAPTRPATPAEIRSFFANATE